MAATLTRSGRKITATVEQAMLRCRMYGHAWDEFYPDDMGTPMYGWRLSLRCTRCTTERHDTVDVTGRLNGRRYIYAEDYQLARGEERPTRDELRQQMYARIRTKLVRAKAIGDLDMEEVS